VTSTQAPEQSLKPGEHSTLHSPSVHVGIPPAAAGHTWPQAPQFKRSDVTSTQVVPQGTKPPVQANEQEESTHTGLPWGGALHVVPQARQFLASSAKTTQLPEQTVSPSSQTGALPVPAEPSPACPIGASLLTQILSALHT
jgi:hypothetical protein